MSANSEKRHHTRITVNSEIAFKIAGSPELHHGNCRSISGTGVSFVAQKEVSPGKAAEIHLDKTSLGLSITAFIEVIRCTPVADSRFEVAAAIKSIKGC